MECRKISVYTWFTLSGNKHYKEYYMRNKAQRETFKAKKIISFRFLRGKVVYQSQLLNYYEHMPYHKIELVFAELRKKHITKTSSCGKAQNKFTSLSWTREGCVCFVVCSFIELTHCGVNFLVIYIKSLEWPGSWRDDITCHFQDQPIFSNYMVAETFLNNFRSALSINTQY